MLRRSASTVVLFTGLLLASPRAQADVGRMLTVMLQIAVVALAFGAAMLAYDFYAFARGTRQPLWWGVFEGLVGAVVLLFAASLMTYPGDNPLWVAIGGIYFVGHGIRVALRARPAHPSRKGREAESAREQRTSSPPSPRGPWSH